MMHIINVLPEIGRIDAARQDRQRSIVGIWPSPRSHAVGSIIFQMPPIENGRRDVCP